MLQTDDFRVRRESALSTWVLKQKLYWGDLLSHSAAQGVVGLLSDPPTAGGLTGAQKQEVIEMLRLIHAVVQPDRWGGGGG